MIDSAISNGHEVLWDSTRIWVNSGEDGMSLGRFSTVGIDVHLTTKEQMETGRQCLDCSAGGDMDQYVKFCTLIKKHYGVRIPERAMPDYLQSNECNGA